VLLTQPIERAPVGRRVERQIAQQVQCAGHAAGRGRRVTQQLQHRAQRAGCPQRGQIRVAAGRQLAQHLQRLRAAPQLGACI